MQKELEEKISSRTARIAVMGVGYVGLPLALSFIKAGFPVIGVDTDVEKISVLNSGKSSLGHISDEEIRKALDDHFELTSDFSAVNRADAIIICVPTPLNKNRDPDLSFIRKAINKIKPHLRKGQILSLESTTYPGTTDEEIVSVIKKASFNVGKDFFVVYSPEREDPGNKNFKTESIPKVIGGKSAACLKVGIKLYSEVIYKIVPVSSLRAAELTKLLENIHRSVNIGLVNEMKTIADKMNIDIFEVIDAAASKPFGFTPYYPGPGLGGHCIPIDPFYLTWKAREYGINARFIELAGEINTNMPSWIIQKITKELNRHSKPVQGAKILIIGLAYKKNINDTRESPAISIMEMLFNLGAVVNYSDPHIDRFQPNWQSHQDLVSVKIQPEILASFDLAVIATDHDLFDFEILQKSTKIIIDTRNVYKKSYYNVIKA